MRFHGMVTWMASNSLTLIAGVTLLGACAVAQARVEQDRDPKTGLEGWHWRGDGASFSFNQRLPDQSRAFFRARGLPPEAAEAVAMACVFQAIIHNDADAAAPLALNLANWRVTSEQGESHHLRLEADWQRQWQGQGVSQPARIAFRWALFPTEQHFQPGDWNMGMVTFDLPPGSLFDLEVTWHQGEKRRQLTFNGLRCASDRQAN